ncbi:MAG: hypothetical protein ACU0GG_06695 [Paracoccaceae bacterium]
MLEVLPQDLQDGLEMARKEKLRRKSRMRVKTGNQTFTILRHWDTGFALDAEEAPRLRGLVDVYDGARHMSQCLIVASETDGGEMVYEFKRATPHAEQAPLDYEIAENAPVGLLTSE